MKRIAKELFQARRNALVIARHKRAVATAVTAVPHVKRKPRCKEMINVVSE